MLKNKINFIFLLIIITISLLFISGCSSIFFNPYGSIEVTTYPSGAKIFLDGKDIKHVTPYTINNLAKGTYEITVTLGNISYTEKLKVYSNITSSVYKDLVPRLNKILVQPSSMNLEIGESKSIDSIIAYYLDSGSTAINPSDCNYSSSSNHAIVDSIGTITGVSKGSATITVSYTDVEITKTDSINVFVKIEPPKAVINVTPSSSGYAPFTVSFDASNSTDIGGIESYGWNFGDGSTGAGMIKSHTYNTPGTYIVTLTVTDFYGNKGIATISIVVREYGCPNANIQVTPGSTGTVPFTVSFDASGSSVNEVSGSTITNYSWDFGDGDTDTGIITTHTYNNVGLYPVILTITDSNGKKDYATVTITVNEPGAPTAVISTVPDPPTGFAPLEIHFDAYNSNADVDITSYDWVFGDGSTGTGASINHTFNTAGTYVTSLTVTDSNGNVGFAIVTITVNEEPVPEIEITVSANPESNVPGGISIISAKVNYEEGDVVPDGTTVYFYTNSGALSADSAETTNGIATVNLTLDDNMLDGEKATVTAFIGSMEGTVVVTCIDIIITISANPLSISPGIPSTITAIVTDKVGNPEVDKIIIFFTTNGTFSSNYCSTNASGIATSELTFTSGNVGDSAIITAKCGSRVSNEIIITCIPPVEDDIVYRALLVGVGDYENDDGVNLTDLDGPPYDVDRIMQVLNKCKFGSDEIQFSLIDSLKDLNATKEAIINGIASTFSDADDDDISYFYFSGHGYLDTGTNISYLCPTDTTLVIDISKMISVDELEIALSAIPGTKVVILDTCHSGGFIGKEKGEITIFKEELASFNNNIVNAFSISESKDLLTTNQYKVLTSCHYYQSCLEWSPHPLDGNPYGCFTYALCKGCGYNTFIYPYPADEDENSKVSLQEGHSYIESALELFEQDVQVYPADSTFTIVEY